MFYVYMSALEEEETQLNGVVVIAFGQSNDGMHALSHPGSVCGSSTFRGMARMDECHIGKASKNENTKPSRDSSRSLIIGT